MKPSDLLHERNSAFSKGDFGLIYDSYHPGSNFRRQFPNRDEYLQLGQTSLGQDYQITACQVLDETITGDEAQVVFLMSMEVNGDAQQYAELAWFLKEEDRWYYHRGLKMTAEDLPENPEALKAKDFERLDPGTIF